MTLDLRIPSPCRQRWDDMPAADDGRRWCARCDRRITDFRGMTDDQVQLVHALSAGPACGVYDEAQLRPAAPLPSPQRSGLVTLALGATLLSGTAAAQPATVDRRPATQQPVDASTRLKETETPPAPSSPDADSLVVRGTVRDEDGKPLRDVLVVVGNAARARTDSLGGYEVRFAGRGQLPPTVWLRFAQLGRESRTFEVSTDGAEAYVDAVLETYSLPLTQGIVITAVALRESFLVRLWKSIF